MLTKLNLTVVSLECLGSLTGLTDETCSRLMIAESVIVLILNTVFFFVYGHKDAIQNEADLNHLKQRRYRRCLAKTDHY